MGSRLGLALLLSFLVIGSSSSQTYYGYFDPDEVTIETQTGSNGKYVVVGDVSFTDPDGTVWTVPSGTVVDGASIPWYLWSTFDSPFTGDYVAASVIHDYYCDAKIRTAHSTHRSFYYGMRAKGVPDWKAKMMYVGVMYLGPDWELTYSTTPDCIRILDGKRQAIRSDCAGRPEPVWHFANEPSLGAGDMESIENYMNDIKQQLQSSDGALINGADATLDELDNVVNERKALDEVMKQWETMQKPRTQKTEKRCLEPFARWPTTNRVPLVLTDR